ncbi:MAG: hypothetical protein L3J62_00660 [Gammaproteobacteria bacterium]|nr:hypothetical protein [Gammaproteobacteria bacterium]MCF6229293.1 hypothetical protein [Gammaproteobacteria bacterium]
MKKIITLSLVILLTGCVGANISSLSRESGHEGSNLMMRCVDMSTSSERAMNANLKKYDGWKMVYASEYTTSNKSATAAVMCFEKPYTK